MSHKFATHITYISTILPEIEYTTSKDAHSLGFKAFYYCCTVETSLITDTNGDCGLCLYWMSRGFKCREKANQGLDNWQLWLYYLSICTYSQDMMNKVALQHTVISLILM